MLHQSYQSCSSRSVACHARNSHRASRISVHTRSSKITAELLGIAGLQSPQDCCRLVDDALQNGDSVPALHSVLQFINACHPDYSWQAAAQAAVLQLSSTALYTQAAAAASQHTVGAASADPSISPTQSGDAAASSQAVSGRLPGQHSPANLSRTTAAVQQAVMRTSQLDAWVTELSQLQAATTAAAAAIQLDSACAPLLLLDGTAAQQHPIWARDYAAFVANTTVDHQQHQRTGGTSAGSLEPWSAQQDASTPQAVLPCALPAEPVLNVGSGASLDIGHHYTTAAMAAAAASFAPAQPSQSQGVSTTSTTHSSSSSSDADAQAAVMPWPLTAASTKLLLSSPLGVLWCAVLRQVYWLGLWGRCQALSEAVDLARLVGQELQAAQEEQRQLGGVLLQQLEQLHLAAHAGSAVDPVLLAAAASAAGNASGCGGWQAAAACPNAVGHPAVAVRFLEDLAAFGKQAAAAELQSWLDLCRSDARLASYLSGSGVLQHLPHDITSLQPHQIEALRQAVALAASNRGAAGGTAAAAGRQHRTAGRQAAVEGVRGDELRGGSSGVEASGATADSWLQDYTDMPMLLPGVCDVLGSCLQLELQAAAADPGTTWCQEAYLITVQDQQLNRVSPSNTGVSSSKQQHIRGHIWLLFDDSYQGMPSTHMVSPGSPDAPVAAFTAAQQPAATDLLLHTTVAIIFPSSFCSCNRRPSQAGLESSTSSTSSGSSGGSSGLSALQGLLHELGHALHFLLSASAAPDPAAAGGQPSSLEVMETASHLVERMAHRATCLQAMLRHRVTGQPPHPALIQQLLVYESISSRGVYQWHQHVLVALADARMAAAAAAETASHQNGADASHRGGSDHVDSQQQGEQDSASGARPSRCWDVLQAVIQRYDPLAANQPANCGVVSSPLMEHLPALAVLRPGDMYSYICADLVAAALWGRYLDSDPLDPAAWQVLRRVLFEGPAQAGTVAVVQQLLGQGSMFKLTVSLSPRQGRQLHDPRCAGSSGVAGWVPDLEHASFQEIDLWG